MMDSDIALRHWLHVRDFSEREISLSLDENNEGSVVQKFSVWLALIEKKNLCGYFYYLLNFCGYFHKFSNNFGCNSSKP